MSVEEIIKKFEEKSYYGKMSNKNIASRLKASIKDVQEARLRLKYGNKNLKVLIIDLETAPMQAYVWGRWKQNIALNQTISEWFIICWSAKWLYSNDVMGDVLTPKEALEENDYRITKSLYDIINKADVVVAHNGNRADIPWMNTRFIIHGLVPPKPYFSVDTCLVARKQFNFSSNRLDALATCFNLSNNKLDTDFTLWRDCLKGSKDALKYMLEYNKMDVKVLEEVYLILRPWIKNHPNISNILSSRPCCPFCGHEHLTLLPNKYYYTNVNKYSLYRCNKCKGISRDRISIKDNKVKFTNNLK